MKVAGERFTVVGAGRSGLAAANALSVRGANVRLVDHKPDLPRPEGLDYRANYRAYTNLPREGDIAVLSPGIAEVSPVRAEIAALAGEVIGEVELFYRLCPAPILAITGTDGKSTVTTMLGAICEASGRPTFTGGNLGNPLCEALDTLTPEHVVVAEISAFQLTTCVSFRPRVALVTNIAEDHLDYHGGFEPYQAAKRRLFDRMTAEDVAILNADDRFIAAWEMPAHLPIKRFSMLADADACLDGGTLRVGGAALMTRNELPLLGEHNVTNALAAALAATSFGIPLEMARAALLTYQPLPHRLQKVRTVDGVRWINDSKATNPNAASAGLRSFRAGDVVWLGGGSSKDANFEPLGEIVRSHTKAAILFGETRDALAAAIGPDHPIVLVDDIEAAVTEAHKRAKPGDSVLLSPACASYDQFRSYVHRGEVFTALVEHL